MDDGTAPQDFKGFWTVANSMSPGQGMSIANPLYHELDTGFYGMGKGNLRLVGEMEISCDGQVHFAGTITGVRDPYDFHKMMTAYDVWWTGLGQALDLHSFSVTFEGSRWAEYP
jgi:hypothetical protein